MQQDQSDADQPTNGDGRQLPGGAGASELVPEAAATLSSELGFSDLVAPEPVEVAPAAPVRWVAFVSTIVGGALGALVGYGIGDVMYGGSLWSSVGALLGALTGAVGLGILANLTMRAMGEWHSADHPEADARSTGRRRTRDREWTRRSTD